MTNKNEHCNCGSTIEHCICDKLCEECGGYLERCTCEPRQIKQVGTIRVTNVDTGKTTYSATYAACDILDALKKGETVESILARLEAKAEYRMTPVSGSPAFS
ncbi:MAG: hypothetical protein ACW99U_20160 [Candidatus Thorarchaeota archaeon]|jgi:hypothetical protein